MTYNESVGRDYIRPVLLSVDSFLLLLFIVKNNKKKRNKVCCVAQ